VSSPYHAGEIALQKQVGVREQARDLEGMYRDSIPANVAAFLEQHTFAVLSSEDVDGNLWASPLAGPEGIFSVPDQHEISVHLNRLNPPLDPTLVHGPLGGLLVMQFDRRLRVRINGTLHRDGDTLILRISQFYGNCTKYIARRIPNESRAAMPSQSASLSSALTDAQRALIVRADTFFIATEHSESGADASHRGGRPGFVVTPDARTLLWPDYRGNNMFNTLGNLESDPRAGLLFIDFDSGASLQLTGKARVDFGDPSTAAPTGRSIRFEITSVRELLPSTALRYTLVEAFPYNPPVA
jgi:predicted pyridoxine 5'-phosphate oxidase superfamily flavin-nucleotide-binding protein